MWGSGDFTGPEGVVMAAEAAAESGALVADFDTELGAVASTEGDLVSVIET